MSSVAVTTDRSFEVPWRFLSEPGSPWIVVEGAWSPSDDYWQCDSTESFWAADVESVRVQANTNSTAVIDGRDMDEYEIIIVTPGNERRLAFGFFNRERAEMFAELFKAAVSIRRP